jgi:hypothetical protein
MARRDNGDDLLWPRRGIASYPEFRAAIMLAVPGATVEEERDLSPWVRVSVKDDTGYPNAAVLHVADTYGLVLEADDLCWCFPSIQFIDLPSQIWLQAQLDQLLK